jgi:hypothetical protein
MPTYKYIILADSSVIDPADGFKFKAIQLSRPQRRTDTIDYTLGGTIDKQAGPILNFFTYVLRVPEDDQSDASYGTMSDLRTLFELCNPNATPSDVITLTDHYGTEIDCYFLGEISPEPLTTMLEGPNAWHIVPIQLQEKL